MRTNSAVGVLAIAALLGAFAPSCTCLGPKPGERGPGASSPAKPGETSGARRDDGSPVLSWFETAAGGKECAWVKSDPLAKTRTVITTVPEECPNATVSWSPDGAKAVLWFPSREAEGV